MDKENNRHPAGTADVRGTSIGYAINLVMDYGSGRQVTISGTLPLGAKLADFNKELDMLRKATNRQQAFVIMRDCEAKQRAESKMALVLKTALENYKSALAAEMNRLKTDPESLSGNSGKMRSQVSAQIENMRSQAHNHETMQQQEIIKHEGNAEIHAVTIASLQKEIDELEKEEG